MNHNAIINSTATFLLGAVVGGYLVWMYAKKKHNVETQGESVDRSDIESENETLEMAAAGGHDTSKPSVIEYAAMLQKEGYTDYSAMIKEEELETDQTEEDAAPEPYVIPPEEFGEKEGFETTSLIYYADHILADEEGEPVDDIEKTVGLDSLLHFGEYEDDSVFVRNDFLKCDYEILRDERKYADL